MLNWCLYNSNICVFTLGVKQEAYDAKGENPDNLCALCKDECKQDGKYSGYSGAFKCMDEDVGQVAFVKHTTVKENKPGMESNYEYLCKNGKRAGMHYIIFFRRRTVDRV